MSECRRMLCEWLVERLHREYSASTIVCVLLQLRQMKKQLGRERRSRRRRIVGHFARTRNQLLGVPRRIEEGPLGFVPEPFDRRVRDLPSETHPLLVESQLVHCEESQRDGGVVLEKAIDARHALLVRSHHSSIPHHLAREELRVPDRKLPKIISGKSARSGRDPPQHEAVPRRKNLFVSAWPHSFRPCFVENSPSARD